MRALSHFPTRFVATSWAHRFSLNISHDKGDSVHMRTRFLAPVTILASVIAHPPILSPYLLLSLLLSYQPPTRNKVQK